jgi:phosphoribosylformylglycinamidine synthase
LVAVAEMALAGGVGATLAAPAGDPPPHAWAFGEDQARYVVAVSADEAEAVLADADAAGVPAAAVGRSGGASLTVSGDHPISLVDLREAHGAWMPAYMAAG